MPIRSRDLHRLKKPVLEMATDFLVCSQLFYGLHNVKAVKYITSVPGLFKIFKSEGVKME